jgi:hypothetical protein
MYYPKSQVKTNLYSQKEYQNTSTQELYQGPYYETSSGKKYTGKFPGDGANILLVKTYSDSPNGSPFILQDFNQSSPNDLVIPDVTSLNYYDYSFDSFVRSVPQYYTPFPTPQETQQGSIIRYFCKKGNEYRYIEINKETYNKLFSQDKTVAWDLYTPISLQWSTVSNTSSPPTSYFENQLGWVGFSRYVKPLKTPTTKQSNDGFLYTSGGEFTTQNGQNYIGYYHIYNGRIPMVGKTHTKTSHEVLIPVINPSGSFIAQPNPGTSSPTPGTSPTYGSNSSNTGGGGSY